MDTKHFLVIGVVCAILLVVLFFPFGGPAPVDCGSDYGCFLPHALNCTLAKADINGTLMEVKGPADGGCEVFMSTPEGDMTCTFPSNASSLSGFNMEEACEGELATKIAEIGEVVRTASQDLYATSYSCIPGTLWDTDRSTLIVHGPVHPIPEVVYCHVTFTFIVPEKTGLMTINHYFNRTDEEIYVAYESDQGLNITEWCTDNMDYDHFSNNGTVRSKALEYANVDGVDYCHLAFYEQGYDMPALQGDVVYDENGQTVAIIKTSQGSVLQKVFQKE